MILHVNEDDNEWYSYAIWFYVSSSMQCMLSMVYTVAVSTLQYPVFTT